ncbi:MAG: LexA family protein [Burkholderiaceae bacterium]
MQSNLEKMAPVEFFLACPDPEPVKRPYIKSRLSAGFPSPAADYIEYTLDLHEYLIRNKSATFYFRVKGDSMNGARIFDGDMLVVDRSIEPKHRHIVVASINGEFTVKRLYRRAGVVELRPENPQFQPIRFNEGQELLVWGVVTGTFCRFDL